MSDVACGQGRHGAEVSGAYGRERVGVGVRGDRDRSVPEVVGVEALPGLGECPGGTTTCAAGSAASTPARAASPAPRLSSEPLNESMAMTTFTVAPYRIHA